MLYIQLLKYVGENDVATYGVVNVCQLYFSSNFYRLFYWNLAHCELSFWRKNTLSLQQVRQKSFVLLSVVSVCMFLLIFLVRHSSRLLMMESVPLLSFFCVRLFLRFLLCLCCQSFGGLEGICFGSLSLKLWLLS